MPDHYSIGEIPAYKFKIPFYKAFRFFPSVSDFSRFWLQKQLFLIRNHGSIIINDDYGVNIARF